MPRLGSVTPRKRALPGEGGSAHTAWSLRHGEDQGNPGDQGRGREGGHIERRPSGGLAQAANDHERVTRKAGKRSMSTVHDWRIVTACSRCAGVQVEGADGVLRLTNARDF